MEFVFEQSWRLLSAGEQDALARLSVFRGGFTIDAARAVAAAAIPVLGALADKSLLRKNDARLAFHPLVQQLAALRLPDGDARASTERAHALHFQRLLAQLRRPAENGDAGALAQIDAEFENCRIAWHWSVLHGAADALAGGAPALFHFCDHRSRFEEGLALLGEARAAAAARERPALAALLAAAMAHLEYRLDRYAAAEAEANAALALAQEAGDHPAMALCLQVLGSCALRLGRYADASRLSAQARQHALSAADPRKAAANLYNQSLAEKSMGHYDEALRLSLQALAQQRRLGDVVGEALSLNNLGVLYFTRQEYGAAGEQLRAGLALCDEHGLSSIRMYTLANLTEHAVHMRETEPASRYARRALEIAESSGNRAIVSWLNLQLAHIALQRGDLPGARAHLCDSMGIAIAIGRPALQLDGVSCLADILLAQGETWCARRVLAYAAGHPSIAAPERDAIRVRLDDWPEAPDLSPAWPGMTLDELVQRIVVESESAYGALIALLRGGAQSAR
ncbi:MAG: tetratricopeptide repeat protein [Betaproteobacteria bacterium]|nr:tetratricopeptide repeat protein [Betaproteobacteria bacterium]